MNPRTSQLYGMNRGSARTVGWEPRFLPARKERCDFAPCVEAWHLLSPRDVETATLDFDLRIANVVSYDFLTIVVFECECRWILMLDRDPLTVPCPEHGGGPLRDD